MNSRAASECPLVSIVIPTYEQEQMASEAVSSALAQDYPNLEVVVVDDASPSHTYDTIRSVADPRLRYHRNERNLGRVANYRRGLKDLARGDWVIMLDGDDYFTDASFVRSAVQRVHENPDAVIVAARSATQIATSTTVPPSPGEKTMAGIDVVRALPNQEYLFMHMASMYRRKTAMELDFYRSNTVCSDWESLYRLALRGTVVFLDRTVGIWRIHGANATRSQDWRVWADNLQVWPVILADAVTFGMPSAEAEAVCRSCLVRFGAMQIPSVLRSPSRLDVFRYLQALWQLDRRALQKVLSSGLTMARLAAGLLGYYRRATM